MSVLEICASHRESNKGSKERQGPTLGFSFSKVLVLGRIEALVKEFFFGVRRSILGSKNNFERENLLRFFFPLFSFLLPTFLWLSFWEFLNGNIGDNETVKFFLMEFASRLPVYQVCFANRSYLGISSTIHFLNY